MVLTALSPFHREALVDFLCGVFKLPKTAPFVEPALLRWKYDEPRPDWQGPRSYALLAAHAPGAVLESREIVAHACICPVVYRLGQQDISGSYLIDWAASRRTPGAGALLLRNIAPMFQVLLALGGSPDTLRMLPKLGYRVAGEIAFFVRVVRSWRQFRTDPFPRGWKAPLRLARNSVWSRAPMPKVPDGWTCSPVRAFDSSYDPLLEGPASLLSTRRSVGLMNYWLRCPGAAVSAFIVSDRNDPRGWFLLAQVGGVTRIADLRIHSSDLQDWSAAFALATRTALAGSQGCELVAAASNPLAAEALRGNGFRFHHADPIFLLDPKGLLGQGPLDAALIESDAAYLYTPGYPYLS